MSQPSPAPGFRQKLRERFGRMCAWLAIVQAVLFGAAAAATSEEFRAAGRGKRIAVFALILLMLGANVALAWWLVQRGTDEGLLEAAADPAAERVAPLQGFELPLGEFAAAEPRFRPAGLAAIRLVFDRSAEAVIILDRVGFIGPR